MRFLTRHCVLDYFFLCFPDHYGPALIRRRDRFGEHLKNQDGKQELQKCACFLALFWAPSCAPYGASCHSSATLLPFKNQPRALDSQKVVSHPVKGPWRFRHIALSLSPENDHQLTCLHLALSAKRFKRRTLKCYKNFRSAF